MVLKNFFDRPCGPLP